MIVNEHELLKKTMNLHIDPDIYQIVDDRKGMPNILFTGNGSGRFIHSSYDAVNDGIRFAESNYVGDRHMAVLGLGLGYHIKPLIAKLAPEQKLYIFEPNLALLKIALQITDIRDSLLNENVIFCGGSGFNEAAKYFFACLYLKSAFILYLPVLNIMPDIFDLYKQYNQVYNIHTEFTQAPVSLDTVRRDFNYVPIKRIKKYRVMILEFTNNCSYIQSFIESWVLAFGYLGCEVIYMTRDDFMDYLNSTSSHPNDELIKSIDFFVTCNDAYTNAPLFDDLKIPIVSIEIDRPFVTRIYTDSVTENAIYTWSDKADLIHAGLYYKQGVHHFLAHGGEINFDTANIFDCERPIDVVISCNYNPPGAFEYLDVKLDFDDKIIEEITELYRTSGKLIDDCVLEIIGDKCDDETFCQFMFSTGYIIENRVRLEKRYKVVKALLDNGVYIHLFGMGWHRADIIDYPNCTYHGYVDCEPGRKIFEKSKILINNLPASSGSGAHERVFSSMMRGALCVSNATDYLKEIFSENNEIVLYDNNDPDDMVKKVKYYLAHEDERLRIAKNAFENVRQKHTWINRSEDIITMYEDFAAKNSPKPNQL